MAGGAGSTTLGSAIAAGCVATTGAGTGVDAALDAGAVNFTRGCLVFAVAGIVAGALAGALAANVAAEPGAGTAGSGNGSAGAACADLERSQLAARGRNMCTLSPSKRRITTHPPTNR